MSTAAQLATAPLASATAVRCQPVERGALPPLPQAKFLTGTKVAAAALRSDLRRWLTDMAEINPDPSIRVDRAGLDREVARIDALLDHPMSAREAWTVFARLNPYLRDGHSGVVMPKTRETLQAYVDAGGHIVPIEVRFDRDGSLRIRASAATAGLLSQGDRLVSINGVDARQIAAEMLARIPGETERFRRAWLGQRFAALFWLLYGDTGQYDIGVIDKAGCGRRVRAEGATRLPLALQPNPAAADLFEWRVLPQGIGYLRIASFAPDQQRALADVAAQAFAAFRAQRIRALIVDVRDNGGGDDPLWQQSVMNYITTTPYAQLSRFALRITPKNADPGDVIGSVQRSVYSRRFTSDPNLTDRFAGPVYILGGPFSYSATIQFMVAAQDFRIAGIAGEETGALSCQTGKVQPIDLPHTGLNAFTPLIAYVRPSGQGCERGVLPDLPVEVDEIFPDRTLTTLAAKIRTLLRRA